MEYRACVPLLGLQKPQAQGMRPRFAPGRWPGGFWGLVSCSAVLCCCSGCENDNFTKAKSCLKTLVNNKVKEQHALHDRIARCEAAMQLMGEPLRAIPQPEFLKLMIVLRDDITAAPVPLQTAVTGKLIQDQLQEAVKTTDRKEALKLVEKIAARMLFPVSVANSEAGTVRKVSVGLVMFRSLALHRSWSKR